MVGLRSGTSAFTIILRPKYWETTTITTTYQVETAPYDIFKSYGSAINSLLEVALGFECRLLVDIFCVMHRAFSCGFFRCQKGECLSLPVQMNSNKQWEC